MKGWALAALLLLAGCGERKTERVDPADYDAFFLWAGVKPPAVLAKAKTVYLLASEVRAGDNTRLVPLRPGVPYGNHVSLWLTVRAERLDWQEAVYRRIFADLARWESAGNHLIGLQIDFDSNTRGLANYAAFLTDLRHRLPARYRLSVTGLLDWSAQGDAAALGKLAGTVDEVVIQTYQGRHTIPGYERYMASLARLPLPYKVALVEGGEWRAPKTLARDPEFKGYVVFLLPRKGGGLRPSSAAPPGVPAFAGKPQPTASRN